MRYVAFAALLLAACGAPSDPPAHQTNGAAAPAPGAPDNRIECRTGAATAFERTCTIEVAQTPRGPVITLRKADGGFRRLLATGDSFVAADGAEAAHVTTLPDGRHQVEIGSDHFRFATRWE